MRRLRALVVLVALFSAGLGLFKVAHSETSALPLRRAPVHLSVAIANCTFVDASRQTPDYATGTSTPGRRLVTEIRYPTIRPSPGLAETPAAPPYLRGGPYPLVVFAHGYDITPDAYSRLLDAWVKAGMVVAAPLFPDTNSSTILAEHEIDTEDDIYNQPADVAFVIRRLGVADSSGYGCQIAKHLFDPSRVGLAGQSDGGNTVNALAFESAYAAPGMHFRAVESLSGALLPATSPSVKVTETGSAPLLVVQSATDRCNPPGASLDVYNSVPESDKWFLALKRGDHLPPYTGTSFLADFNLVVAETRIFFADEFKDTSPAAAMTSLARRNATVGTLTSGPAPALARLSMLVTACYQH